MKSPVPVSSPIPTVKPSKFSVFQAINDVASSIKKRPAETLLPLVLSYVVSIVIVVVVSFLGLGSVLFSFATNPTQASTQSFLVFLLVAGVLQIAIQVTFNNAFVLAIRDAFLSRNKQTFGTYLRQGVQLLGRVILATLLVMAYVAGPVAAVVALIAIMGLGIQSFNPIVSLVAFLGCLGAMAWAVIAILRYALSWQVAVFEPTLSIQQILARSRTLMTSKARWFLVRGYLLSMVAFFAISIIAGVAGGGFSASHTSTTTNVLGNILSVVLVPFMYGVPAVFYLKLANDQK